MTIEFSSKQYLHCIWEVLLIFPPEETYLLMQLEFVSSQGLNNFHVVHASITKPDKPD